MLYEFILRTTEQLCGKIYNGHEFGFPPLNRESAVFKTAKPYQEDEMNLPVENLEETIPFHKTIMGFQTISRSDAPCKSAVLARDHSQIGLAENGGDPTQEGCFFEVNDVEATVNELKANELEQDDPDYRVDIYGDTSFRVFFIVAPDKLCYCIGQRL